MKKTRARYSDAYREEALAFADRVVAAAAAQPALSWRAKAQQKKNTSEGEQSLAKESVRLKRQLAEMPEELAITKKGAVYFAKNLK